MKCKDCGNESITDIPYCEECLDKMKEREEAQDGRERAK